MFTICFWTQVSISIIVFLFEWASLGAKTSIKMNNNKKKKQLNFNLRKLPNHPFRMQLKIVWLHHWCLLEFSRYQTGLFIYASLYIWRLNYTKKEYLLFAHAQLKFIFYIYQYFIKCSMFIFNCSTLFSKVDFQFSWLWR